jgi:peptidoglycan-associated lipoprotein
MISMEFLTTTGAASIGGSVKKQEETMKFESHVRIAASLFVLALLAACASEQKRDESAPNAAPGASAPGAASGGPAARGARSGSVAGNTLNDPKSMLFKRSVFYEFDQTNVKTDYRSLVEAHARYLRDNPGANITIEGNCDERGSREYNLALGQRRADGVKSMMTVLGVPERQIDTVSFGEEKPKASAHEEGAWSQNRRSDIVYRRVQ